MTLLNVAEICPATRTLGPGLRFVIWVQGCCFTCPGCVSPDWIPQKAATLVQPQQLADQILSLPQIEGITISGGEPMLQASALSELIAVIQAQRDLSIICYSGFTLAQLRSLATTEVAIAPGIAQLLSQIDVLIDGQYIAALNDNRGWRGSANQTVHFLTDRYSNRADEFTQRRRDIEIHVRDMAALMVGVPPIAFSPKLKQALRSTMAG
jgi:anaerobic ribonucleoside-triphosphate reductase activating protein